MRCVTVAYPNVSVDRVSALDQHWGEATEPLGIAESIEIVAEHELGG